ATQTTFLHDFVHDNLISVDQAAQDIRDNGDLSDDQRLARLRELRQSPFFRVPPAPNETNYARDMELAMWMKWLLGTDRLVVSEASSSSGVTASARTLSNNPVNTSPSARSYPTSRNLQSRITRGGLFGLSRGTYVKRQDVQYGRIGGDINDRIDTVHRARFGREFFHDSWAGNEANDRDVLRRAERRLRGLANRSTWQR
ncbi:MAG TPA: hypothetical protein VJ984_06750, partial [Xanthomonadales bacterium]|nr:hypothetical protein [Xanthomonadales bacterium]